MNQLLASIRDRKGGMRSVITNKTIYHIPDMINSAVIYSPEDSLEESEWFYLPDFSTRTYCPNFVKTPLNGTAYALIDDGEIDIISYICSIQDDNMFCFQKVSKNHLLQRRLIVFGSPIKYNENSREIVINSYPDAIYRKSDDRLFFQKLSSITAIFNGIEEVFKEATAEDTANFLQQDFLCVAEEFDNSRVKQPNRKRIALAKAAWAEYDQDQRSAVLGSIREYYPSIVGDGDKFIINNDEDLTYLLYGFLQRYYTTADGREKRIARSVQKL